MKFLVPGVAFLLAGCATIFPTSVGYSPVIIKVMDQAQYEKDLGDCHKVADNYHPNLSVASIAQQTVTGATDNTAEAVINPLVPVAGAAGGFVSGAVAGLGINGQASIKIFVRCLDREAREDHSFIIADPNE